MVRHQILCTRRRLCVFLILRDVHFNSIDPAQPLAPAQIVAISLHQSIVRFDMASSNSALVEYWEDQYVQSYMSDSSGDMYLSQVDSQILYDGLARLKIKVAGETTGVDGIEWFKDVERPDIRNPFSMMVSESVRIILYLYICQFYTCR